jgi:hypothetical protein
MWRAVSNAGVRPEEDPGLLLHQGNHILHGSLTKASGTKQETPIQTQKGPLLYFSYQGGWWVFQIVDRCSDIPILSSTKN